MPRVAVMAGYPRDAVLTQAHLAEAHQAAGDLGPGRGLRRAGTGGSAASR